MDIIQKSLEKLSERHKTLKAFGKIPEAIKASGVSKDTYFRVIRGENNIEADTLESVLKGQKQVIDQTIKKIENA